MIREISTHQAFTKHALCKPDRVGGQREILGVDFKDTEDFLVMTRLRFFQSVGHFHTHSGFRTATSS